MKDISFKEYIKSKLEKKYPKKKILVILGKGHVRIIEGALN